MRLLPLFLALLMLQGCCLFGKREFVYPDRPALEIVPRPAITPNPADLETAVENQRMLIDTVRAWEGVVIRHNEEVLAYDEEHGYPGDPDSVFIRRPDGSVVRPLPDPPPVEPEAAPPAP